MASSADCNAVFRKYLGQVQDKTDFIPGETDVDAQYSTFRTPRKLSTTRLERAGFGDELQVEISGGRKGASRKVQDECALHGGSVVNAYYLAGCVCN